MSQIKNWVLDLLSQPGRPGKDFLTPQTTPSIKEKHDVLYYIKIKNFRPSKRIANKQKVSCSQVVKLNSRKLSKLPKISRSWEVTGRRRAGLRASALCPRLCTWTEPPWKPGCDTRFITFYRGSSASAESWEPEKRPRDTLCIALGHLFPQFPRSPPNTISLKSQDRLEPRVQNDKHNMFLNSQGNNFLHFQSGSTKMEIHLNSTKQSKFFHSGL